MFPTHELHMCIRKEEDLSLMTNILFRSIFQTPTHAMYAHHAITLLAASFDYSLALSGKRGSPPSCLGIAKSRMSSSSASFGSTSVECAEPNLNLTHTHTNSCLPERTQQLGLTVAQQNKPARPYERHCRTWLPTLGRAQQPFL